MSRLSKWRRMPPNGWGLRVKGAPRTVEAAIALRFSKTVEDAYDLHLALVETRLTYCVLHQDGSRFPESGWLGGSVGDLADIARLMSVPQKAVEQAADTLEQGIGQAANRLEEMAKLRPNITPVIARLLGMRTFPRPAAWPVPSSPTPWSSTNALGGCMRV